MEAGGTDCAAVLIGAGVGAKPPPATPSGPPTGGKPGTGATPGTAPGTAPGTPGTPGGRVGGTAGAATRKFFSGAGSAGGMGRPFFLCNTIEETIMKVVARQGLINNVASQPGHQHCIPDLDEVKSTQPHIATH
jgi:hypothetical protein